MLRTDSVGPARRDAPLLQWEITLKGHFPRQPSAENDDFERRSQLISLVYEVLRDMKTPIGDATTIATHLSRAFLEKATSLANLETTAPRGGESE
jgi:hypothetical protein